MARMCREEHIWRDTELRDESVLPQNVIPLTQNVIPAGAKYNTLLAQNVIPLDSKCNNVIIQ